MPLAIETFHLSKRFGDIAAVDGLSFSVARGDVFGLLGRNGAGKTVTMRMLAGLVRPSGGEFALLGDVKPFRRKGFRQHIAYISQTIDFPAVLDVQEVLTFCASMYASWDSAFEAELVNRFELPLKQKARALSLGMKLRLAFVCAVCQRAEILLLDEPSGNLDPLARRELLSVLAQALDMYSPAVLFATHLLQDLERIVNRVIIMDSGKSIFEEKIENLNDNCRKVQILFPESVPEDFTLKGLLSAQSEGRVFEGILYPFVREAVERSSSPYKAQIEAYPVSLNELFCELSGKVVR